MWRRAYQVRARVEGPRLAHIVQLGEGARESFARKRLAGGVVLAVHDFDIVHRIAHRIHRVGDVDKGQNDELRDLVSHGHSEAGQSYDGVLGAHMAQHDGAERHDDGRDDAEEGGGEEGNVRTLADGTGILERHTGEETDFEVDQRSSGRDTEGEGADDNGERRQLVLLLRLFGHGGGFGGQ